MKTKHLNKPKDEVKTHSLTIRPQFKRKRDAKAEKKQQEGDDDGEENDMELQQLQGKIKRQPSLWKAEFSEHLKTFKKSFLNFREDPARDNEEVVKYIKFMTHISDVYKKELSFLATEFIDCLEQNYNVLHPNVRFELVQSLRMMRTKKLASATDILPLFFRLFRTKDKALRKYLFTCIIGDLKIVNKKAKATNVNKTLQNFVYNMIKDPQEMAAKKTLQVMVELYKKKIWNDENTVNVIAEAALQKSSKLCMLACKFFLLMDYDEDEESSDDESSDIDNVKSKIMNTRIGAKMSRKKKHNLEKTLKQMRRKKDRKGRVIFHTDFLPIDLVRCPQEYAEKLFYRLRKSNEKLDVKLHMMKFIGRLIGRHKLIMFNFYPFISKYINTHQKELAEFLAMVAESTHINVPHEEVSPLIEKILDNFVNERATPVNMTIALNAIREICARNPNAMNKEQLQYCIAYYKIKNKSVSSAIKSLINLFRDLRPELLEKKQLGKEEALKLRSHPAENMVENTRLTSIDGIELLREHEGLDPSVNIMGQRLLTEKDFKLIKMLKLQKKAEEAKEDLKLNLKGYEVIDKRFAEDEHHHEGEGSCEAEGEGHDHEHDDSDEFDADAEESEEEQSPTAQKSTNKAPGKVKFAEDDEFEVVNQNPHVKERSDGIKYNPPMEEDIEIDISVSDTDSDPDRISSGDDNPHNFLDGSLLNTYKKSKYQKMAETYVTREEKLKMKKERAKDKHSKNGKSKTNKEKLKNKPMSMVMPKKLRNIHNNYRSTKERLKELKTKLGKVKDGKLKVHRRKLKNVK